jgi:hypothetical protein
MPSVWVWVRVWVRVRVRVRVRNLTMPSVWPVE